MLTLITGFFIFFWIFCVLVSNQLNLILHFGLRILYAAVLRCLLIGLIIYVILAGKQTVECNFEDTFKCGYTTSTTGTVSWERISGKTFNNSPQDKQGVLRVTLLDELHCTILKIKYIHCRNV